MSASAGKVVEITGKVSATRDGKTRDLALGAEVFRDDQIATAADATVTIELFHNGAKWAVMANKSSRVDASLAWGLDKQEAAKAVEHNSAAAGRNAEKSAADTQATTAMTNDVAPSAAPAAPASIEAAPAPPAPGSAPTGGKAPPPPPPPPPKPMTTQAPMKDQAPMKNAPRSEPRTADEEQKKAGDAPADKAGIVISPQTLAEKQRPALAKCLGGKKASLTINVTTSKTTTAVTGEGVTPKMKQCMDAIVQKIEWPLKGTFELTLKFD